MNVCTSSLLVSVFASFMALGPASANLIANGSFEQGPPSGSSDYVVLPGGSTAIDGWVVTGVSVDYSGNGPAMASDGDQFVGLAGTPGPGGVQQELATEIGEIYRVSFDLSASPSGDVYEMLVSAAGASGLFSFDTAGHTAPNPGWLRTDWDFTATSTTTLLTFENVHVPQAAHYGAWIDDVVVTPEPGVFSLFAGGLLVIATVIRRQNRN